MVAKKAVVSQKITKSMTIGDVATKHPEAVEIMIKYGLHCVGCHVAFWETIEQGAKGHGMSDKQLKAMLSDMNKALNNGKNK
ncbi:MAG TPA: DUF1858 domain-containing protein [archaeon]|nr:DUF1858 domain-containing protein [archaeon]